MAPLIRTVHLSIDIQSPPDKVFAAVIDLPKYNAWLPKSTSFQGTTEFSETPPREGTKYEEHSSQGIRYGEIQKLDEAERHVIFHQPMKMKPLFLGVELDITVDMIATPADGNGCVLRREIHIQMPALLGLGAGLIVKQFEGESLRTMKFLKAYLEKEETVQVDKKTDTE